MGESQLLQALIGGFILLIGGSAAAGGVAALTFRVLIKNQGDLADRFSKAIDDRDEMARAKIVEMEAQVALKLELAKAIEAQANIRNELSVVNDNAHRMDEAVASMGRRLALVENEKKVVETERDLLKVENTELKVERDRLQTQIDSLKAEIEELKDKVTALETQNHLEDAPVKSPETATNSAAGMPPAGVYTNTTNPALVLTAPDIAIVTKSEGSNPL